MKECLKRKQLSRFLLTLENESIGSKQDQIPWQSMQSNMIANTRNKQKLFYSGVIVNTLSNSPGEYYCKIETQRN